MVDMETELVTTNSLRVGDEITFADQGVFIINRVEEAPDDGITLHTTFCDDKPSRTLVSMTFPRKANIRRFK